ncbi:hypothetical protein JQ596_23210 [Bradyrhizobium manausense]|uniref:hypothetical protein n=1 Tax=Bradyrhizobium manausense TaxID=989370 RepID=UPI001BABC37E|nr:hypothetical protein [Bradyrhizobium manausense]MBR0828451.1 hypothetical protein [Bradyrhizobium manausense]
MGMLDPGRFLISCPECGAWPMAAKIRKSAWATPNEVTFVCGGCGFQEMAIISASGQLAKIEKLPRLPRRARPAHRRYRGGYVADKAPS